MEDLQACRVCLATGVKLYDMYNYRLKGIFELFSGIQVSPADNYPQYLCTYCSALLLKCNVFRLKCRKSQELLKLAETQLLTTSQIQAIAISNHTTLPFIISNPVITTIPSIQIKTEEPISEIIFKQEVNEQSDEEMLGDQSDEEPLANKVKKSEKITIEVDIKSLKNDDDGDDNDFEQFDDSLDFDNDTNVFEANENDFLNNDIEVKYLSKEEQLQEVLARKDSYNYIHSFYKCEHCYKGFIQDGTYKNHMLRHDPANGEEICDICKTRWPDTRSLKSHVTTAHERKYICKLCDQVTKSSHRAKEHLKWHKGFKFVCKVCGAMFDKSTSHLTHLRLQHPSKYCCDVCGESFIGEMGLNMHKKKAHKGFEFWRPDDDLPVNLSTCPPAKASPFERDDGNFDFSLTPPGPSKDPDCILPPDLHDDLPVDSGSECDELEDLSQEEIQQILDSNDDVREVGPEANTTDGILSWFDDYSTFTGAEEIYTKQPGPNIEGTRPFELFSTIWDHSIMQKIADETNNYAWQTIVRFSEVNGITASSRLAEWYETEIGELYKLFAIFILMGICHRTRLDEYWATGVLGMPDFRKIMPKNRFLLLLRFLHFVDNYTLDPGLHGYAFKNAKVAPIIAHCNERFQQIYTPQRHIRVTESLLLWNGRPTVQCQTKPPRFGIKSFELSEATTGYLVKIQMYCGLGTKTDDSTAIMLNLIKGYLGVGHCLIMDTFYNSVGLTRFLKYNKTDVISTLDRRGIDTPYSVKVLKEELMHRGDMVRQHCGDISVVAFKDVKLTTMVSTYHNSDTGNRVGEKPAVILDYNKYMNGVKHQKLDIYLFERKRGVKWYLKVFKKLLNSSIFNTYIIYRANEPSSNKMTHLQYIYKLAQELCQQKASVHNIRNHVSVSDSCRLDGIAHFPNHIEIPESDRRSKRINRFKRGRCSRCISRNIRNEGNIICSKCQVFLCIGNCWQEYHTLEQL